MERLLKRKSWLLIISALVLSSCQNAVYDQVVDLLSLPMPEVNVESGLYNVDQTIEVVVPDEAAYAAYSLKMNGRTVSSGRYTEPILISGHNVQFVFSVTSKHPDRLDSKTVSRNYRITYERAEPVVISLPSGDYSLDQTIELDSITAGGQYYYRTDGREPKDVEPYLRDGTTDYLTETTIFYNNPDDATDYVVLGPPATEDISSYSAVYLYTEPIALTGHGTTMAINAFTYLDNLPSSGNTAARYSLFYNPQASPVFSPETGTTTEDLNITMSSPEGGTISYRYSGIDENGNPFSQDWTDYAEGDSIALNGDGAQISIEAVASGAEQRITSLVAVGTYYINKNKTLDPAIRHDSSTGAIAQDGDSVSAGDNLYIVSETSAAKIFISYLVTERGSASEPAYPYIDHVAEVIDTNFPDGKTRIENGSLFTIESYPDTFTDPVLKLKIVADAEETPSSVSGTLPDPSNVIELELDLP